ncbi:unnamed protein product [Cunninghamella blakesleeana]
MVTKKHVNRMSIEHILCSPVYGLPSPTSSYHSSDDEYDIEDTYSPQHYQSILFYQKDRRNSSSSSSSVVSSSSSSNPASPNLPTQRIPWTPDEDKLLKQGYEQGLSWAMIASTYLPHRSRGCCWGRFKTLKNKKLLTVRRKIRAKERPWKSFNPCSIQQ